MSAPEPQRAALPDEQRATPNPAVIAASGLKVCEGTCHVMFAYDVGLAIDLQRADQALGAMTQRETIRRTRKTPPYVQIEPAPIRVTQQCAPLDLAGCRSADTVDAVIYDFAAISVTYRFPLEGPLERLLALSDEIYDNQTLLAHSHAVTQTLLGAIRPAITKPRLSDFFEDYAIFEIRTLDPPTTPDEALAAHAGILARILRSEQVALSQQEVEEALRCRISFGSDDIAIMDWNAALLIDPDADDTRTVLEYANVELLEMRYLDDQLDAALERGYAAVSKRRWPMLFLLDSPRADLRRIAELQVDNAQLFEGVNNALKLVGDQYLARVYRLAAERLHLNDWDASILRKLGTLESMYEKVSGLTAHLRAEILEWIIIILIAISIFIELAHRNTA